MELLLPSVVAGLLRTSSPILPDNVPVTLMSRRPLMLTLTIPALGLLGSFI